MPHYSTTMSLATEAIARVNRDHGWEVTYRKAADGCEADVTGVTTLGIRACTRSRLPGGDMPGDSRRRRVLVAPLTRVVE